MTQSTREMEITDMHQMVQVLQNVDVGLLVVNTRNHVLLWNSFMENHSGIHAQKALGKSLFELFPELPEVWFRRKTEAVFKLGTPAYSTWEQHPHPFHFKSYRPLTGHAELMFQNLTLLPLLQADNTIQQLCILVYDVTETAVRKQQLEQANQELARLSRIDRLSGLYNRGYWQESVELLFKQLQRNPKPASLIILDIDHFKAVNDTYGHQTGDVAIQHVARLIKNLARETDLPGRYGGEEFVLLLPDTDLEGAEILAERIRSRLQASPVFYDGLELSITASLGVSSFSDDLESATEWIHQADQALYTAKKTGRNRVCCWPQLGK